MMIPIILTSAIRIHQFCFRRCANSSEQSDVGILKENLLQGHTPGAMIHTGTHFFEIKLGSES